MSCYVHVAENPRRLALRAKAAVLCVGCLPQADTGDRTVSCTARLEPRESAEVQKWPLLISQLVYGCLGIISTVDDVFIAFITAVQDVGLIGDGERVNRIVGVSFYSLLSDKYDKFDVYMPRPMTTSGMAVDDSQIEEPFEEQAVMVNPCANLQKLLCNGHFYFSTTFDLTRSLQARSAASVTTLESFDPLFLWNEYMVRGLLDFRSSLADREQAAFDQSGFLVSAIQGFAAVRNVQLQKEVVRVAVLSRLSCMRAGTRFNTRGVDDNGSVANFVETEVLVYMRGFVLSSVQIRGSVPVFWEQQGLQVMAHKIQISRGAAATQPAVDRHFAQLIARYQQVHIVNLLSQKEGSGELTLSDAFTAHVAQIEPELRDRADMTTFDFHAACRGGSFDNVAILMKELEEPIEVYGASLMDVSTKAIVLRQRGIFRTNCLDCLDRTNVVQSLISRKIVENYLATLSRSWHVEFAEVLAALSATYADNGDALSKMYAGTAALKSGITRTGKMTLAGFLDDATKSVTRMYLNNFADKAKQEIIDTLLGKLVNQKRIVIHDPVHEAMTTELRQRSGEYHSKRKVFVAVGTYNVNGKLPTGESLFPWLEAPTVPDLYVLGFQEIVELSPQQIMSTDPSKRAVWEDIISGFVNRGGGPTYVLLRSGQLVGAAIMVFVKEQHVTHVRNVECVTKKTGLRGISGNKGAIAVRFDFHDTSLCFVTAHLAAGVSNYDERNKDFHTITSGLTFAKGRTLMDHENVIWLGDFNYRIDLQIETVKSCIEKKQYDVLARHDQLNVQRLKANAVFGGFTELDLKFDPTYKYDNGTSVYDTSEKMRIPAWTDRILFRGPAIRQLTYQRAELYLSDHRPVKGLFEVDVLVVDKEAKDRLQRAIYRAKKDELGVAARMAQVKVDTLIDFGGPSDSEALAAAPPPQPQPQPPALPRTLGLVPAAPLPRALPHAAPSLERKSWWDSTDSIHESFLSQPEPRALLSQNVQNRNPFEVKPTQPAAGQHIRQGGVGQHQPAPASAPTDSSAFSTAYIIQAQQEQMGLLNDPKKSAWQPMQPTKVPSSANLAAFAADTAAAAPPAAPETAGPTRGGNDAGRSAARRDAPPLPPKKPGAGAAANPSRRPSAAAAESPPPGVGGRAPAAATPRLGASGPAAPWLGAGGPAAQVQTPSSCQRRAPGPGKNPFAPPPAKSGV